jgi:hypothetical protein
VSWLAVSAKESKKGLFSDPTDDPANEERRGFVQVASVHRSSARANWKSKIYCGA